MNYEAANAGHQPFAERSEANRLHAVLGRAMFETLPDVNVRNGIDTSHVFSQDFYFTVTKQDSNHSLGHSSTGFALSHRYS